MSEPNLFSQWLKARRKDLDLTQNELAELVPCSVTAIRKFENNTRRPSKHIAERMADVLKIPAAERLAFLGVARQRRIVSVPQNHTNLPLQLAPFVGRQKELQQVRDLLTDPNCRLITLVGPGGIGKTRLAIQIARRMLAEFTDGVFLVQLAALHAADFIVSSIAKALGFTFWEHGDPQAQLVDYLRKKNLLLVMDNFEHVLEGASILNDILLHAPNVKIIVTSWAYLNLNAEWLVPLQGLEFPDLMIQSHFEDFDAVQLFIQSARRIQPRFVVDENLDSIARICQYVEGMPLGIELAAGWLPTISCHQIAAHIAHDLDFLQNKSRNEAERHDSLRTIFDRAWKLLLVEEREVFMRLSIFRGGFTFEAAQAVAHTSLPVLKKLVEKSLISLQTEDRYTIHEFLRQYTYQQLEASGELPSTKAQFVRFYVDMAKQSEIGLKTSLREDWVRKLNAELDHFRLIRDWCRTGEVPLEDEVSLLAAPWIYWCWCDRHITETNAWCAEMLERAGSLNHLQELMVGYTIGSISYSQGRYAYGLDIVTEMVEICRERQDDQTLGFLLAGSGITLLTVGRPADALPVLEESVAAIRRIGEEWFLPIPMVGLALTHMTLRDLGSANRLFAEALAIAEKYQQTWEIGIVLYFASHCSLVQEEYPKARAQIERAIAIQRNTDYLWSLANLLDASGHIFKSKGELEQAEAAFRESLELYQYLGNQRNVVNLLLSLGKLAFMNHQDEQGSVLLTQGLKLCQALDYPSGFKGYFTALANHLLTQNRFQEAALLLGVAENLMSEVYDPLHAHLLFESPFDYAEARRTIEQAGCIETWSEGSTMSVEQIVKIVSSSI